jgi:hypothetical protein
MRILHEYASAANSAASSFNFSQLGILERGRSVVVNIVYSVPTNSLNGGGATALAVIGVAYTDSGGSNHQVFPVTVPAGTTVAKTQVSVTIPAGSYNFAISPSVQTRTIDTSGTLTMDVFEAYAQVTD